MKKIANDRRVLISVNQERKVTFNDADIIVTHDQRNNNIGEWRINLDVIQSYFYWFFDKRDTPNVFGFDTNNITKVSPSLESQIFHSYIFVEDIEEVANFYFEWIQVGGATAIKEILFKRNMPNLENLRLFTAPGNTGMALSRTQNLSYLKNLKYLLITDFTNWIDDYSAFSIFNDVRFVASTMENGVGVFDHGGFPNVEVIHWVFRNTSLTPTNIIDLSSFFRGTAKQVKIYSGLAGAWLFIKYEGGAVFPSVIEFTEPIINQSGYTQTGILHINSVSNFIPMDPNDVSRFIVDFANQVTAVNLPAEQKRIVIPNSPANTSYTDPTQPLFTTYTDALAHITGTLGVTVNL